MTSQRLIFKQSKSILSHKQLTVFFYLFNLLEKLSIEFLEENVADKKQMIKLQTVGKTSHAGSQNTQII